MPTSTTPKRIPDKKALGLALRKLRKRADLTQEQAAERADVVSTTWRRYELGQRDLSFDQLGELAQAIGFTREELLNEHAEITGAPSLAVHAPSVVASIAGAPARAAQAITLPVRDRVQAGAWLAADDSGQVPARFLSAVRDQRYPHAEQWLSEVVGDSVNQLFIFDGDLVHCVDAIGIGYTPKTGDLVEVERLRFDGQERELTLKQIEISADGAVQLWPRSTNPRWREPLALSDGLGVGEDVEIRIRGLVISAIRRFT